MRSLVGIIMGYLDIWLGDYMVAYHELYVESGLKKRKGRKQSDVFKDSVTMVLLL